MVPKVLKIRGHIYTIRQVKGTSVSPDRLAEIDFDHNVISIPQDVSPALRIELLLHEVSHAMIQELNLDNDEEVAIALGEALTAFLWDNPAFIRDALKKLSFSS